MFNVRGTLANGKEFKMVATSNLVHEAAVELAQQLQKSGVKADQSAIESVTFRSPQSASAGLVMKDKRERKVKPAKK